MSDWIYRRRRTHWTSMAMVAMGYNYLSLGLRKMMFSTGDSFIVPSTQRMRLQFDSDLLVYHKPVTNHYRKGLNDEQN